MRHHLLDEIATQHVIERRVAPAASLGLAYRRRGGWKVYTGAGGSLGGSLQHLVSKATLAAVRGPAPQPVDPTSPFDLASISKPFLAILCARLQQQARLDWQERLDSYLPEIRGTAAGVASLECLLSHRAGLQAHVELFRPLVYGQPHQRLRALRCAASALRRECQSPEDGARSPVYSDLGYILVAAALERHTSTPLDELILREVCQPLSLEVGSARQWLRKGHFKTRVVPTEVVAYRGGQLVGAVHDDNCWALAGHGCAGHAGLFAPIQALLTLGTVLVDTLMGRRDDFLTRASLALLLERRPGGSLRCGFDGRSEQGSSAGLSAGERTFGHLGFTGTSWWCDPDAQIITALFTNRVNPTRDNPRIRMTRPLVHDALFQLGHEPGALERT